MKYNVYTVSAFWQAGWRGCEWKSWSVSDKGKANWAFGYLNRLDRYDWEPFWQNLELLVSESHMRTWAAWNSHKWPDLWFWFLKSGENIWILSRNLCLLEVLYLSYYTMKLWRDQVRRVVSSAKSQWASSWYNLTTHKAWGWYWRLSAYLVWVFHKCFSSQRCCAR